MSQQKCSYSYNKIQHQRSSQIHFTAGICEQTLGVLRFDRLLTSQHNVKQIASQVAR